VLVPILVHYFPFSGVVQLLSTTNSVKKEINPKLQICGFVLTMFDKRNNWPFEIEKEVRETLRMKFFRLISKLTLDLAEAPSYHKPIILYKPSSRGAKAYEKLAKEFL
jgi:chromosome partitioning protein